MKLCCFCQIESPLPFLLAHGQETGCILSRCPRQTPNKTNEHAKGILVQPAYQVNTQGSQISESVPDQ